MYKSKQKCLNALKKKSAQYVLLATPRHAVQTHTLCGIAQWCVYIYICTRIYVVTCVGLGSGEHEEEEEEGGMPCWNMLYMPSTRSKVTLSSSLNLKRLRVRTRGTNITFYMTPHHGRDNMTLKQRPFKHNSGDQVAPVVIT